MKRRMLLCLVLATATMPLASMAQGKDGKAQTHNGTGTVKSVDTGKGTVLLVHGPIPSMNWPAMTMTFRTKDKAVLDKLKPGANVEFSFVQSGKNYVVTDVK